MNLHYLTNKEIDYTLWDSVIEKSQNGIIYANSWYLDIVAPNWHAIVSDNYEYVLPVTIKRNKLLQKVIILPQWVQQLGVFSEKEISTEILQQFLNSLLELHLPVYDYPLNSFNNIKNKFITEHPNYVLALNKSYSEIFKNYNQNTKRNIKKVTTYSLKVKKTKNIDKFIDFTKNNAPHKLKSNTLKLLKSIIENSLEKEKGEIYLVENITNEILAATFILKDKNRLIYRVGISSVKGKSTNAMFFLVDYLIQHNCNKNSILDFEGSSIEGVARFYKGFGAINQPYFVINKH